MLMPANKYARLVRVSVEMALSIIGETNQAAQSGTHCSLVQNNPWQRKGVPQRRQRDAINPPQQIWCSS